MLPRGGYPVGCKVEEAPAPMRRGASVVLKRKTPQHPCSGGLGGPETEEAPAPMRRGP